MKYVLNVYIEALSELKGALTSFAANSFPDRQNTMMPKALIVSGWYINSSIT